MFDSQALESNVFIFLSALRSKYQTHSSPKAYRYFYFPVKGPAPHSSNNKLRTLEEQDFCSCPTWNLQEL